MNYINCFDGKGEIYAKARPKYVLKFFYYLKDSLNIRTDNTLKYDRQGYINRVLPSSYSLKKNDEKYTQCLEEINGIFDMFSKDGYIEIPTETIAFIGLV